MSVLRNRIKQLRKERNVSQQKLADFLEIERTSLSKIENQHYNPSSKTMTAVAQFFDVPLGDIFFSENVLCPDTVEISRKVVS